MKKKTFGGEARRYFAKYPQFRPRTAVDVLLKAHPEFGVVNRKKLLNEARQYKHRANRETKRKQSCSPPPSPDSGASSGVERVDAHRNVWPSRKGAVSHWLRDTIVKIRK